MSNGPKIFAEDVTDDMMAKAFEVAQNAFETIKPGVSVYSGVSEKIREDFDKLYGTSWNCVVGRDFGAVVTHCTKTYERARENDRPVERRSRRTHPSDDRLARN